MAVHLENVRFTDIVTSVRYWIIHSITIPALFYLQVGYLFRLVWYMMSLETPRPK